MDPGRPITAHYYHHTSTSHQSSIINQSSNQCIGSNLLNALTSQLIPCSIKNLFCMHLLTHAALCMVCEIEHPLATKWCLALSAHRQISGLHRPMARS